MALGGPCQPTVKNAVRQSMDYANKRIIAVQQSTDHASQQKKLQRSNQLITPANRKNCGAAINGSHQPEEKIVARQSGYHACLIKNCTRLGV
jgi:hypothetical protein